MVDLDRKWTTIKCASVQGSVVHVVQICTVERLNKFVERLHNYQRHNYQVYIKAYTVLCF
jgi:hypothetical protein